MTAPIIVTNSASLTAALLLISDLKRAARTRVDWDAYEKLDATRLLLEQELCRTYPVKEGDRFTTTTPGEVVYVITDPDYIGDVLTRSCINGQMGAQQPMTAVGIAKLCDVGLWQMLFGRTPEEQEAHLVAKGCHTRLPQDPDLLDRIDR